jgi:hypothetical protein
MRAVRVVALVAALLAAGAVPAEARLLVGLGDQQAATFRAPAVRKLGFKAARLNLAWDWYRHPWMVAQADEWMAAVREARARPMVALGRNWSAGGSKKVPRMGEYVRGFRRVRSRYPFVRDFSAWNEPNVRDQPTWRKPWLAARYYDALVRACPHRCTIVGGDVGDNGAMRPWLAAYQRHLRHRPKVWALHNYHDANERTGSTARFLRLVRGSVWLTETGGVKRRVGLAGQRRAVARIFAIARSSRRIRRVYFYQWRRDKSHTWDSAFLNADGTKRPAYRELVRGMRAR